MRLLFFHGKGLINSLVRWQTNSHFAHVAIQPDGWSDIFEAVPKHGVRRRRLQPGEEYWESSFANVSVNTRSGRALTFQSAFAYDFLQQQVGKKYDYQGVLRFLTREKATQPNEWFCSELAFAYLQAGGIKVLNIDEAWRVSPGMLALSPFLTEPARFV